jgi:maleate isomerase
LIRCNEEDTMKGWRAKLGFLVPAGTPTVEREMVVLAPPGVSVHFSRMVGRGADGTLKGLEDRLISQIEHMDESAELLASVKPNVIVLAHTATSYRLGRDGERELSERISSKLGIPFISSFGSVLTALECLGTRRIALATPYDESLTLRSKANLEDHGYEVLSFDWLRNVRSIFDETEERVYGLGRSVDVRGAEALFISGVGLPTISVIAALEMDLGKPVVSSASATMWNALRTAGLKCPITGYGRLLEIAA